MRINFITLIPVAVLVLLLFSREGCNCNRIKKLERHLSELRDTCSRWRTVTDTHYVNSKELVYVKVPEPILVEVPRYISSEKVVYRSGEVIEPPPDSVIKQDYFSIKHFRDSIKVQYGSIIIYDTLTQNDIYGRSVSTNFDIPVLTNNIFVPEKQKTFGYINLSSQFIEKQWNAAGLGFTLLARNRKRMYSLDALFDRDRRIVYQLGLKFRLNR